MIANLLKHSRQLHASDLHIGPFREPFFRIDGQLVQQGMHSFSPEETLALAKELLDSRQFATFMQRGECDFAYEMEGVGRFRIQVYKQRLGVSIAIRVIPQQIPSFADLGLPTILHQFIRKKQGLLLVTGPTGSGKSTTLASMIQAMNQTIAHHIITLEDPIEFVYPPGMCIIDQREVGVHTHSFAHGLRAALREDPDVILVGELRDLETVQTAITAAETGHLVLATLHTVNGPQTIERIIGVFPSHQQQQIRIQVASVLLGIVAQRLLPNKQGQGRVAVFEILVNTPAVANLIRSDKLHQIRSLMQTGKSSGMQTMQMHAKEWVQRGILAEEVVGEIDDGIMA